ncbi:MAG: ABC transporter permease, partial [bacterium]
AIGAPNSAILLQFLTEAIVLTGSGGVGGLAAGWALGAVLTPFLELAFGKGIKPEVPWNYALITVAITCTIGIIFGVYPAMKASRMDPIRALRFD